MATPSPNNAWDRLYRAMRQVDPNNPEGAWQLITSGTVNIIGGGSGGTSTVDNNPFTPGGTSITPMGGYYGGRSIASGNTAAPALNGSAVLQVDVISTSAAAGAAFATVAVYGSPAFPVYVQGTVNLAGGAAPYASVAVYGSPAFPVYVVGSVNVQGSLGMGNLGGSVGAVQLGAPWSFVGSVNPVGVFAPAGSVNVYGSVNIVPPTNMTVWLANQNAGAGFASVAVYGSPAMPVYVVGSVNVQGSLGVGQIGAPWSMVGSMGVTALNTQTVMMGNIPTVNLGLGTANIGNWAQMGVMTVNMGLGTVNVGNAHGIFGSVSILGSVNIGTGALVGIFGSTSGVATVNLAGVGVVDVRGSLTATQWIISTTASGQYIVTGSAPANQRVYLSSYQIVATGTIDLQWQSPSGVAVTGSMRILPGAGFGMAGNFANGPILLGSLNSALYLNTTGTQHVAGVAIGWVGP